MNKPEKNIECSKRLCFRVIYLSFYLVIILKIAPGTSENFTSTITSNGVSKTIATFPINELWSLPGTSNFVYHKAIKNCSKVNQFIINLRHDETNVFKPPPLIAALVRESKRKEHGKLKGTDILLNLTKPLTLVLCNDNFDLLELAKSSALVEESFPSSNIDFGITYSGKRKTQVIKTAALEFASISVAIFYDPPACILVDNLSHKLFWSDSIKGTIEYYDSKKNTVNILVNFLSMPKSMVIDSILEIVFWCNAESVGSIERINFNGGNRVAITKEKYDLHYPNTLGIDQAHQMIYWTADKVIHTSDYNGNFHKIIKKSEFYDPSFSRCISFTKIDEYNVFWEMPPVPYYNRSFAPNNLVSIFYQRNDKQTFNDVKFPMNYNERILQQSNWRASHICQKNPSGYRCFLLPVLLKRYKYIKVKRTLSKAGYKPMMLNQLKKFHPKHEKLLLNIESFYFNSKSRNVFYYDPVVKKIRYISSLEKHPIDIVKNVDVPINGYTYDGINDTIHFINASENCVKMTTLDKNNFPITIITTAKNTNKTIFVALSIDIIYDRLLFFTIQYSQYKAISNDTNKFCAYIIQNVNTSDIIIIGSINNTSYLINTTTNSIEILNNSTTDNEKFQPPLIFSYITTFMNYKNNVEAQAAMQKYIFASIFNLFIKTLT